MAGARGGGNKCQVDKRATTTTPAQTQSEHNGTSASSLGCMAKRISMMLEEVIEFHWFAGFSPEKFLTEAGRLREAMVAAD